MKVVLTTFTYAPNLDGVAEASRFVAEHLADLGHDVTVLTSSVTGRLEGKLRGVRILSFDLHNRFPGGCLGSDLEVRRYQELLVSLQPDVLINQCWDSWTTVLSHSLFDQLKGCKILVSHGYALHLRAKNAPAPFFGCRQWIKGLWWTVRYLPDLVRSHDRIIFLMNLCDGKRFLDHSLGKLLHPRGVRVIPNSPNLEMIPDSRDDFRRSHGIGPGPMILCVANFSERKNQELAIRIFWSAGFAGSTLVCIGSEANEYYDKVSAMVRNQERLYPNQKVLLLPGLSRSDAMKAYAACDMTLLTAKQETMPFVLIESMAFAKPWIATRSGCIPAMEGGISVRSKVELVSLLRMLMNQPDYAARLGAEGRKAYDMRYEPSVVKSQWTQLIAELSSSGS